MSCITGIIQGIVDGKNPPCFSCGECQISEKPLEQFADVIMSLYRDFENKKVGHDKIDLTLTIHKNGKGPAGKAFYVFDKNTMDISAL